MQGYEQGKMYDYEFVQQGAAFAYEVKSVSGDIIKHAAWLAPEFFSLTRPSQYMVESSSMDSITGKQNAASSMDSITGKQNAAALAVIQNDPACLQSLKEWMTNTGSYDRARSKYDYS